MTPDDLIKEAFERRKGEEEDHSHTITFTFKATWAITVENGKPTMSAETARRLVTSPEGGKALLQSNEESNQFCAWFHPLPL